MAAAVPVYHDTGPASLPAQVECPGTLPMVLARSDINVAAPVPVHNEHGSMPLAALSVLFFVHKFSAREDGLVMRYAMFSHTTAKGGSTRCPQGSLLIWWHYGGVEGHQGRPQGLGVHIRWGIAQERLQNATVQYISYIVPAKHTCINMLQT